MKTILTYGTFDLFHIGHLNLLRRLKAMGDHLIFGVSTDEFNLKEGKQSIYKYQDRADIVEAIEYVDCVIPEQSWQQKLEIFKSITLIYLLLVMTGKTNLMSLSHFVRSFIYPEQKISHPPLLNKAIINTIQ